MKIIQIVATSYEIYGLDDEGNIYELTHRGCEKDFGGKGWRKIKLGETSDE